MVQLKCILRWIDGGHNMDGGSFWFQWKAPPYGNFAVDTMDGATICFEIPVGWTNLAKFLQLANCMGFDVKIGDNDDMVLMVTWT